MRTFIVKPGDRLGPFGLGDYIGEVLEYLRSHEDFSCVEIFSGSKRDYAGSRDHVEHLDYFFTNDEVFDLLDHGIRLYFEYTSQRLRIIEIYDFTRCKIRCVGETFGGSRNLPSYSKLYAAYGATLPTSIVIPGKEEDLCFPSLFYPGLLGIFPEIGRGKESPHDTDGQVKDTELLSALALRMYVCPCGSDSAKHSLELDAPGETLLEVRAVPAQGILCHFRRSPGKSLRHQTSPVKPGEGFEYETKIRLHESTQDVIAALGNPEEVFRRKDHKGYIMNYFAFGIDIVCTRQHQVSKILLHANDARSRNFGVYIKCHFKVCSSFDDSYQSREINETSTIMHHSKSDDGFSSGTEESQIVVSDFDISVDETERLSAKLSHKSTESTQASSVAGDCPKQESSLVNEFPFQNLDGCSPNDTEFFSMINGEKEDENRICITRLKKMISVNDSTLAIKAAFGYLPQPALHPAEASMPVDGNMRQNALSQLIGYPGVVFEILNDEQSHIEDSRISSVTIFDPNSYNF